MFKTPRFHCRWRAGGGGGGGSGTGSIPGQGTKIQHAVRLRKENESQFVELNKK